MTTGCIVGWMTERKRKTATVMSLLAVGESLSEKP
jgi:hypothetical protein